MQRRGLRRCALQSSYEIDNLIPLCLGVSDDFSKRNPIMTIGVHRTAVLLGVPAGPCQVLAVDPHRSFDRIPDRGRRRTQMPVPRGTPASPMAAFICLFDHSEQNSSLDPPRQGLYFMPVQHKAAHQR
jgi:hypothetical protein